MIEDNNTNCNKLKDLEHNTQLKNLNDINNQREESDNGVIENVIQTCHKMKNISRKDVTEIENKVNKSNDVKQTDINKLKEVDLIEQTNNTDIVLLNLWKKTGTLSDDKSITIQDNSTNSDSIIDLEQNIQTIPENSVNSDTIIDLEQIIKPNNVYFMINNEGLKESINRVLENEIQTIGYERGTNISRKDVTEIENKINKSNDVKQTDTNKLKEIVLIEQTNKTRDIVLLNLKNTTSMSSEDKSIAIHDNSINSDSITVLEHNIQLKNLTDKVNNHNEVLENVERTKDHQISTNISRTDVTEIENKVNKSNNVEKTDTDKLKEVVLIKQMNNTSDIVLLNLENIMGTLSEDKSITIQDNSIHSDSIIDLEQNIQLTNLTDKVNNPVLEACDNEILENVVQTTEGHQISKNISRIDVMEIENKVNKSNNVEQTDTSELKEIPLIEQTQEESIVIFHLGITETLPEISVHSDTIIDLEHIKPNNVNFMINNEKLEGTVNGVENEIQTTGNEIGTNISRKDVTEIENKINKSNDVKQADTNKLKEVALIEQTHKIQDIVVLNLGKTTGTLTEDKIINSDDTILDLEKNVNDMTNKEMIEASVNGIIDNEERHNTSLKISRKDVTEIKNNNVELKEMSLKKQHNKKDSLLMEDLDESYESSEEEWNPTDHSEDEFDMDIITSAVPTKRENNYATQKLKFRCPVENCDAAYRKKWLLEDHIRKHNKERPFHCTIEDCKKSFTKEAHLKRHNILVHEKSGELACDVKGCGLIYNNKYSLKKHKNQVHNALKWPFFCNECCIGFKKKWQLNQHNYKHTGEPPFKCPMCNIGFTVQRDLTKHNRNHKTYSCDCGEIFERWSHLNHHKKKCSAKKDNICKICDKKFSKKENLTAHHASIHQESKELELFHCPYLNCTRSYKYKKNVNFHISSFHEKNNREEIPCPTCGKIFQMPLYLNRHLEKMHKLPKISKPRATRKDKNKSRTYTAAVLAGLKLSQKDHMDFLKNPEKQLIVRITRIDLGEIETKVNSSNDNVKQIRSNELKYIGLTEQSSKKDDILILNLEKTGQLSEDNIIEDKSKNCQTQIDSEQNIQLKFLNDMHRTELSVNGILQIEEQTTSPHKINTRIEENISTFSDDVVVACNSVLKIIEECIL
ncbi:unnamed protein product [Psylliodes chrysocephalus]|uniref:C2H2-type domain-containing protein n=1 Tax=Psylliodes chrysocephalus TaxID=3402493 RepID=A0A9P0G8S4_9CUCU|nr:unnamed protein product [Psylliodes chrysocephala]